MGAWLVEDGAVGEPRAVVHKQPERGGLFQRWQMILEALWTMVLLSQARQHAEIIVTSATAPHRLQVCMNLGAEYSVISDKHAPGLPYLPP